MKRALLLILLVSGSLYIFGQDSNSLQILPFDLEKYNELFDEDDILFLDSLANPGDSLSQNPERQNNIQVIPVPENEMSKMPNMPFKKDVHYTMRIKWYNLYYPYERKNPPDTTKSSGKLYKPLNNHK